MKVTIDACIFGAWLPLPNGAKRALDVGTGTGLLSLMLAQRFQDIEIDAVEIDPDAALQAQENVAASRYAGRINVIYADVRDYSLPRNNFDVLLCNPPFFSKSLQSPAKDRNAARHDVSLSLDDLLALANRCLKPAGQLAILLPVERRQDWIKASFAQGWAVVHQLLIKSLPHSNPGRIVTVMQRGKTAALSTEEETLTVYEQHNTLNSAATTLLQPFYLRL